MLIMTTAASHNPVAQFDRASRGPVMQALARTGYVASGVLHILIGWLALQVAWGSFAGSGGSGEQADQSGALEALAGQPLGGLLLWVVVAGCAGLGVWQLVEALTQARRGGDASDRVGAGLKALGKAVAYLAIAVSAGKVAMGSGTSGSKQSADLTAQIMEAPGGRVLVVLLGVGVVAIGVYHVHKGLTRKFRDDLDGRQGPAVERLAVAGYVAKGVVLGLVGVLFVVAGVHKAAGEATGLDGALRTLREQAYGPVLLTVVALGLAAYGLYSVARARYARL